LRRECKEHQQRTRAFPSQAFGAYRVNLPRAIEIMQLQKSMAQAFERGEEPDVRDFNARFMLLCDEFMKAIKEPEQRLERK
jgi:hypothetical protein